MLKGIKFAPRNLIRGAGLIGLALLIISVGIVYATGDKPSFLTESTSDVAAGSPGKSYQIWYTTDCDGGADCECDNQDDTDTNDDGTDDEDSPNDCVATTDSDSDGVFDDGPDDDGDGVLDVVDLDWTSGGDGSGLVESVPYNVQRTVNRYVGDWNLQDPKWDDDENRDVYVHDHEYLGLAHSNGDHFHLDTEWMLTQAPEPRGSVLHELWHMTQYKYGTSAGNWLMEGQARMLQDKVFDDLDNRVTSRYHNSVNSYLGNTTYVVREDRDDDGDDEFAQAKGLKGASYNASLWWTYLADQAGSSFAGTAGDGMDALIDVLEQADDHGRQGVDATDQMLRDNIGQGFDDTFWDFTVANYAKTFDLSELDHDYLDGRDPEVVLKYSDEKPTAPDQLIYGPWIDDPIQGWFRGVERETYTETQLFAGVSGSVLAMSSEISSTTAMSPYGANYYEGIISPDCTLAYWRVIGEDGARFMHSWLSVQDDSNGDGDEEVVSLLRSGGKDFARALWTQRRKDGSPDYTRMVGIVATSSEPYGYDWEMGCTQPSINIVEPTTDNPAYVGDPDEPGRFLVWTEVTGAPGTTTYVAGLEWSRDFTVTVGTETADILNGGYVQNQYWLVVEAPKQTGPGVGLGSKFDLEVQLGPSGGISDSETDAVVYDLHTSDQVLVIDRSGSMGDFNKLTSAQAAARLFSDVVQQNDMLGVVSFSDDATEEYSLTTVPDQDDSAGIRAAAQNKIDDISDDARTSVGDGLDKGQTMLNTDGNPDHDWVMVLLSDGMENEPQYWHDVDAGIIAAGTKVHAIALGQDADEELMREIAQETCGDVWVDQCYHYIEESGVATAGTTAATGQTNELADVYRRARETIAGHQRLWQDDGTLSGSRTINVEIEEAGARDAFFSFNWNDVGTPLNVGITGPSGASFIKLEDKDQQNHVTFYAKKLPPGTYKVQLSASSGDSQWIGSLSGRLIAGTELHAFLDNTQLERYPGLPVHLQASLTDDGGAVRDASVVTTVRRPDGRTQQVELVDDGGPYDDIANDGVYGYVYDQINRPLKFDPAIGHTWIFDIRAEGRNNAGEAFTRYKRLTYTPYLGREQKVLDWDDDGMLDRWEDRFDNVDSSVPDADKDLDEDGLTNKEEFELGTNPDDPDSDKGGELDGSEVDNGQDPRLTRDDAIPPITDFWVKNQPESVILNFNPRPEYQSIRVYRKPGGGPAPYPAPPDPGGHSVEPEAALAGFSLIGTVDAAAANGRIKDGGLTNDQDYFYYVQPVGASGVVGAPSQVLYAEPAADPEQPEGMVVINDDDKYTYNKNVTLSLQGLNRSAGGLDVSAVQISNSPDLTGVPWQPFQQQIPWTIAPDPDGVAFVYVRFRDHAGNVSDVIYGDGILYKPPVVLPPGLIVLDWLVLDFTDSVYSGWSFTYTLLSGLGGGSGTSLAASTQRAAELPSGLGFGGQVFELTATNAQGQSVTELEKPAIFEVTYEDWQWQSGGVVSEVTLNLYRRTESGWEPVSSACAECGHDMQNNVLKVEVDTLGEFALLGEKTAYQYLPIILR